MEKLKTYIDGFDELTFGGFPFLSNNIIAGAPGTGKTTFCFETAFRNAKEEGKKSIIFTTVSEPPFKMIKYLSEFDFFDKSYLNNLVFIKDLGEFIRKGDKEGLLEYINSTIKEIKPQILVIDSFKSLTQILIKDPAERKKFVYELTSTFSVWGITSLLVGEYLLSDIELYPEFSITDGIIYLFGTQEEELQKNYIQILKLRGSNFLKGKQYFEITQDGIKIKLRLRPEVRKLKYKTAEKYFKVKQLDKLFINGIPYQSSTLISGATGSGKTITALTIAENFLRNDNKNKVIFFTFEEFPELIQKYAKNLNINIDGKRFSIEFISPVELDIDFLGNEILNKIKNNVDNGTLVVLDSISSFRYSQRNDVRYREFLWGLNNYLKYKNVTSVCTFEIDKPFDPFTVAADMKLSLLSDNILVTRYYEEDSQVKRAIFALKSRGNIHSQNIYEFEILDGEGIIVKDVVKSALLR